MDKYEYKVRSEEIRNLIAQGAYEEAAEIADMIEWRRVKSVMMLCTISDLYKINRRFEDSKELLLLAYERHPGGRTILYSLCELSIKMGEFVQAIEYYKEFVQIAPKDTGRYILQYKLYVAQEVSLEERIEVLEELKKRDYREKWAYELAYLYHRVGLGTRCVEECDELILWFGEGKYVTKAMELKMLHQSLTTEQQAKYEGRFEEENKEQEAVLANTGLPVDEDNPMDVMNAPTVEISNGELEDIQVKTMDVGEYNTINLQKALADSMKDLWEGAPAQEQQPMVTEEYFSADTEELNTEEPNEEELNTEESDVEEPNTEELSVEDQITKAIVAPLFQDTDDMTEVALQLEEDAPAEEDVAEEVIEEPVEAEEAQSEEAQPGEAPTEEAQEEAASIEEVEDLTATQVLEEMKKITLEEELPAEQEVLAQEAEEVQPHPVLERPEVFDKFLGMEYDGQMSFVVPESEKVEKQITGQLNIEDILAEWERMKQESEKQRAEEVRQLVLQHTGNILIDFDQAVKDGLLEKLESSEDVYTEEVGAPEEEAEITENVENVEEVEEPEEPEETVPTEGFEEIEDYGETEELEEIEEAVETEEEITEEAAEETVEEEVTEEAAEETVEEEVTEEAAEETVEEEVTEEAVTEEAAEETVEEEVTEEAAEEIAEEEAPEAEKETETAKEVEEKKEETAEAPALRALTQEEKELYASFIQNRKSKEQLIHAIDSISLASYTGNIIITGEEGMDTLTLAKNIMKEVQMTDSNFSGKIAKISGSSMNQRDLDKILGKLDNGALIVEGAGKINVETGEHLYKALQQESKGLIVVLEGTKKSIGKLLERVPSLQECFNARVNIEALDNDSLVAFGKKYAKEQEYSIDEMGLLALHTKIADRQTSDHAVTLIEVKEMMDEAMEHANKKTIGHFFDILFAKRYDEEDMIVLRENDFIR